MKKIYKTIPIEGDFISLAIEQTENKKWNCEMFLPKTKSLTIDFKNKSPELSESDIYHVKSYRQ